MSLGVHQTPPLPSMIRWGLAPMEGVTDIAFRLWYALTAPPAFVWTPFLRVTDTFPAKMPDDFAPELTVLRDTVPFSVIPQLMGSRPEDFVRTAEAILLHAPFVDLNCGCPSPTVVGSRAGSSLLEKVDFFANFVSEVVRGCGEGRVSVKMRTGFHDAQECSSLVAAIANLPLAQLTIHGRTRPQRYTGSADWSHMHEAGRLTATPVVGSGDVCDRATATALLAEAPRVRTAIIGRGALRNPWIFGREATIPLVEPLIAFALLQHLGMESRSALLGWARDGGASTACGNDRDRWTRVVEQLQRARGDVVGSDLVEVEVHPRALARVKMLWNYLRSSLPPVFMEPTLMRAKSLPDFVRHLNQLAVRTDVDAESVPLRYRKEMDWLYSGQGRSQPGNILTEDSEKREIKTDA